MSGTFTDIISYCFFETWFNHQALVDSGRDLGCAWPFRHGSCAWGPRFQKKQQLKITMNAMPLGVTVLAVFLTPSRSV